MTAPSSGSSNGGSARLGRPVRLLLLAVWSGLLVGILEVVLVQVALRARLTVRLSADYVWMAPLFDVTVAVLLAGAILLFARLRQRDPVPAVLATLAALGITVVAFYLESLHKAAVLLLAAGVGSQAARLAGVRWARRLFVLVPVTGLLMAGWIASSAWRLRAAERDRTAAAERALPGAPAGAPNVLLLILDTVRRRLDATGDSTTTPAVDQFARRGVSFDFAIAPAPWTLPSHASFFTGRWPVELSTSLADPLDDRYPTLAEYLTSKGYRTAGFVGNLSFATRASGLARGFVEYHDYPTSLGQVTMSSSLGRAVVGTGWLRRLIGWHELPNRRHAATVANAFLAWQQRQDARPFFAFLNFFDAHEPYFPEDRSGSVLWPKARWTGYEHVVGLEAGANAEIAEKWTLTAEEIAIHAGAYRRAAAAADAEAGRLLAELDRRGVLANTVVIVAGDHGEQTGQHRLFGHLNSLYLPTLHVPLAIVVPGGPRGVRVGDAVSLRDLPATVVDLVGRAAGSPFPGRSLARWWADPGDHAADTAFSMLQGGYERQARYPIGHGKEMFAVTTTRHRYIRNADGSEELFDLVRDPAETANLAADSAHRDVLQALRAALATRSGRGVPATGGK